MSVRFRDLLAGDVVQLQLQPSQHMTLGFYRPLHNLEEGLELAEGGPGWTAIGEDGRILCCAGFRELWPGCHAVAWAMLAADIGAAHLAVTRFARARIADSPLPRIEAIVRAKVRAERAWAQAVGLKLNTELHAWGPDGETHLLYERVLQPRMEAAR
jgi:hypothetical protein